MATILMGCKQAQAKAACSTRTTSDNDATHPSHPPFAVNHLTLKLQHFYWNKYSIHFKVFIGSCKSLKEKFMCFWFFLYLRYDFGDRNIYVQTNLFNLEMIACFPYTVTNLNDSVFYQSSFKCFWNILFTLCSSHFSKDVLLLTLTRLYKVNLIITLVHSIFLWNTWFICDVTCQRYTTTSLPLSRSH